jgi:hypothetical protein
MEVKESEINKKRVSLREQKKSQTVVVKLRSVVANGSLQVEIKYALLREYSFH